MRTFQKLTLSPVFALLLVTACGDNGSTAGHGDGGGSTNSSDGGAGSGGGTTECTPQNDCIVAPACATTQDCEAAWAGDACKSHIACDLASSVCTFELLDKDADGHSPLVCGGDDCDDNDADRYPGAVEVCNGKDNDCSGGAVCYACCLNGAYYECPSSDAMNGCSLNTGPGVCTRDASKDADCL